jgi:hypothetical protein
MYIYTQYNPLIRNVADFLRCSKLLLNVAYTNSSKLVN